MLIQEQQQLYSHESAPPQESKAKAARHLMQRKNETSEISYSNWEEQSTVHVCPQDKGHFRFCTTLLKTVSVISSYKSNFNSSISKFTAKQNFRFCPSVPQEYWVKLSESAFKPLPPVLCCFTASFFPFQNWPFTFKLGKTLIFNTLLYTVTI